MRHVLFAVLFAVPAVLVTWVVSRGVYGRPGSRCDSEVGAPLPAGNGTDAQAVEAPGNDVEADREAADIAQKAAGTDLHDPDAVLKKLFAAPMGKFTINGEMELYDEKGLFDYIDGAAPIYIDHHFRKLAAAELTILGGELTCDVYDMAATENAAAVFAAEGTATATPVKLGDAARKSSMALVFRKDRYYVKLTAFDADAEAALAELANLLLERMP